MVISAAAISTLLGIAVSAMMLGQAADAYQVAEKAGKKRTEFLELAKQISEKLNKNNTLLAKFQNAYNSKNNNLLNSLYRGMGFGPRMDSLVKQIRENEEELQKHTQEIGDENTALSKKQEEISNLNYNLGTSNAGNEAAGIEPTWYRKVGSAIRQKYEDIKQNINGGIQS